MARQIRLPSFRWKIKNPLATPPADEPYEDVFEEMTLQEHLEELRNRIVKICIAVGVAMIGGLIVANPFLEAIKRNAHVKGGFTAISPTDPLTAWFKAALYIAIAVAAPLIVYQIMGFLAPGLTRKEKRVLFTSLPFVSILFVSGAAFAFFFAAPNAFKFLSTFNSGLFDFRPTADNVLNLYLKFMIGMGIAFEMPVIMFLLAKLNILSAARMARYRKYAVLLVAIMAAIITPTPDPINMLVVAAPLYVLYEFGLILARLFAKPVARTKKTDA